MEDEYVRASKEYEGRALAAKLVGGLTVAGWLWALGLVLVPAAGLCGSPAFYQPTGFHMAEVCDSEVIGRIGGAVAVFLATIPLGALWAWTVVRLRDSRTVVSALAGR
ncbi:hypothetical protein [Streptomyces sp. CBMA156]|uniref:hypothetical protein n=1 Tax=Streptomyces sp. CBMA156 TaxID=1930280 RepID=UPI00166204F2|nr:hypothetical protein [Streptomyces sp. CBMA156]MBD0674148.1 hypothetical protein [Streptomyces sp. CBMA156]